MSKFPGLTAANQARAQKTSIKQLVRGVAAGLATRPRKLNPVRAYTRHAGAAEWDGWRKHNVFSAAEKEIRLKHIKAWSDEHQKLGDIWGLITAKEYEVIKAMMDDRDFGSGRLDAAWSKIVTIAKCCRQTLSVALRKFETLGLIERWRRSVKVENPEPGGPTTITITNAYFLKLPAEVAHRVRAEMEKLPAGAEGTEPAAREPNDAEKAALRRAETPAEGETFEERVRREHRADTLRQEIALRRNRGASAHWRDSTF